MPTLRPFPAACLAALLAAVAAGAQETPKPEPPKTEPPLTPPVTSPTPDGAVYTFKYKIGNVQKFRGTTKMDATVTPEGGGIGSNGIPVVVNYVYAYGEKVTGTRQGTGTIAVTLSSVSAVAESIAGKFTMRSQGGKTTVTVNGQPVQANAGPAAQLKAMFKPGTMRRSPSGVVALPGTAGGTVTQLTGTAGGTIVEFPATPLKIGDTWETQQTIRPTLGEGGGLVVPPVQFQFTHTLRSVETKGGKKLALIDSTGNGSTTGAGETTLQQSIQGTTRFDVTRGVVVSSFYNVVLGMQLPPGTLGPQGGRLDGTMEVTIRETPAPAPTKKPVKKKR
jgi:hypothetical protein